MPRVVEQGAHTLHPDRRCNSAFYSVKAAQKSIAPLLPGAPPGPTLGLLLERSPSHAVLRP
jgi:hypothetical protein